MLNFSDPFFFHSKPLSSSISNKKIIIKYLWSIIFQASTKKYPKFSERKKTCYWFRSTNPNTIAYFECFPTTNSLVLIRVITEQRKQLPSYFSMKSQELSDIPIKHLHFEIIYHGLFPKNLYVVINKILLLFIYAPKIYSPHKESPEVKR